MQVSEINKIELSIISLTLTWSVQQHDKYSSSAVHVKASSTVHITNYLQS